MLFAATTCVGCVQRINIPAAHASGKLDGGRDLTAFNHPINGHTSAAIASCNLLGIQPADLVVSVRHGYAPFCPDTAMNTDTYDPSKDKFLRIVHFIDPQTLDAFANAFLGTLVVHAPPWQIVLDEDFYNSPIEFMVWPLSPPTNPKIAYESIL